jgi:hypothetical protein
MQSLSEQSVCVWGYGAIAPYGAEKFEWNPSTREPVSVWVSQEISLPNGIPSMSAATGLIYDVGQRNGVWTMEALSWQSGASIFHSEIGPDLKYNSAYAGTEVGLGGGLYTGTLAGILRVHP